MAARRVEKSGFGKERDGFFWKRKKGKLRRNFHGYFLKWTDRFRQSWIDCDLLSCSTGKKRNLDILSGYVSGQRACDRFQGLQRYAYEDEGHFGKGGMISFWLGTVRYVGLLPLENDSMVWYGIEWDDDSRGKHNGSVKDKNNQIVQIFQCPEGHGSFVRENKIQKGISIEEAIIERYSESHSWNEVGTRILRKGRISWHFDTSQ